jgi:hypothetical protein
MAYLDFLVVSNKTRRIFKIYSKKAAASSLPTTAL